MNDIIRLPDEVIETARQYCDDAEARQWVLGDFICDVVEEFELIFASQYPDDEADRAVRKARAAIIRELANRTGRDTSTLRDRHLMASFFPPEVRVKYEALTYSQMRACKSAGAEWKVYADWALDNLPAPVSIIRARVKNGGELPPAWVARWERMMDLAEKIMHDSGAPKGARYSVDYFLWLVQESGLIDKETGATVVKSMLSKPQFVSHNGGYNVVPAC